MGWVGIEGRVPALAPPPQVSEVLSELGPALEEPLARGHPGVVIALLGAAQRHPRLQGDALRWLFQVGHAPFCANPLPLRARPHPLVLNHAHFVLAPPTSW